MNQLVEMNKHGQYEWNLTVDVHGFWDRFLDGLAERGEIIPKKIGVYELNASQIKEFIK